MTYSENEIHEWIEDRIEAWHITFADDEEYSPLHEWLGWTWDEYGEYIKGNMPDIAIDQFTRLKDTNAI